MTSKIFKLSCFLIGGESLSSCFFVTSGNRNEYVSSNLSMSDNVIIISFDTVVVLLYGFGEKRLNIGFENSGNFFQSVKRNAAVNDLADSGSAALGIHLLPQLLQCETGKAHLGIKQILIDFSFKICFVHLSVPLFTLFMDRV